MPQLDTTAVVESDIPKFEIKAHKTRIKAVTGLSTKDDLGNIVNIVTTVDSSGIVRCWDLQQLLVTIDINRSEAMDVDDSMSDDRRQKEIETPGLIAEWNADCRLTCAVMAPIPEKSNAQKHSIIAKNVQKTEAKNMSDEDDEPTVVENTRRKRKRPNK